MTTMEECMAKTMPAGQQLQRTMTTGRSFEQQEGSALSEPFWTEELMAVMMPARPQLQIDNDDMQIVRIMMINFLDNMAEREAHK